MSLQTNGGGRTSALQRRRHPFHSKPVSLNCNRYARFRAVCRTELRCPSIAKMGPTEAARPVGNGILDRNHVMICGPAKPTAGLTDQHRGTVGQCWLPGSERPQMMIPLRSCGQNSQCPISQHPGFALNSEVSKQIPAAGRAVARPRNDEPAIPYRYRS